MAWIPLATETGRKTVDALTFSQGATHLNLKFG